MIKLRHQANDHTNHQLFLNFCQILQNSAEIFHGLAQNSAACGKLWALVIRSINSHKQKHTIHSKLLLHHKLHKFLQYKFSIQRHWP